MISEEFRKKGLPDETIDEIAEDFANLIKKLKDKCPQIDYDEAIYIYWSSIRGLFISTMIDKSHTQDINKKTSYLYKFINAIMTEDINECFNYIEELYGEEFANSLKKAVCNNLMNKFSSFLEKEDKEDINSPIKH